jgi:4-methyl-5(b-hydroxyethyl)-thiazole monophosphate biosynthesis
MSQKRRVLVPLAPGFEEIEAVAVIDVLRRAGCQVVVTSVGAPNPIVGRSQIRIMADIDLGEALAEWDDWDLVVLPGGLGGTEGLEKDERLLRVLRARIAGGQPVAAICAAPRLLIQAGLPADTPITGHASRRSDLSASTAYRTDPVVVTPLAITSRGPGTAVAFALACVERLFDSAKAEAIRQAIHA